MGTFGEASINIELASEKDAEAVCEMIHNIKDRIEKRLTESFYFEAHDLNQQGSSVWLTCSSSRYQNTDWQVLQVIGELRAMVKEKDISEVAEFSSSLMIASDGYYMESYEFEPDHSGRYSSIHDFIEKCDLKEEADKLFGEGWEAEDDVQQIKELVTSVDSVENGYTVGTILEKTKRDSRADDYIEVTKID